MASDNEQSLAATAARQHASELGLSLTATRQLGALLDEDLVTGDGWWAGGLATETAAVLSDHAGVCLRTIETNLVEAALHRRAFNELDEEHARWLQCPAETDDGTLVMFAHRPVTLESERREALMATHVAGAFRGVTGALDCIAAVTVFVAAIPTSVIKADFGRLRRYLAEKRARLLPAQAGTGDAIESAIAISGPPGWLSWIDETRNALLHRGRRMTLGMLSPRRVDGKLMWWATHHMPVDPALSDMAAMILSVNDLALVEPAQRTMGEAIACVEQLAETISAYLANLWRSRRADHGLLLQPASQFDPAEQVRRGFHGFSGAGARRMNFAVVSPDTLRRLEVVQRCRKTNE